MPRIGRVVVPGLPYHVTQRGNNRDDVFFTDEDRVGYLAALARKAREHGLDILAYCLMTNHIHLIVVPRRADSLAKALGETHHGHTRRVNARLRRSGHLWQNRYFSCALDETHLWMALRYVERNPVRASLVKCAWEYRWSSAAAHSGRRVDAVGILDMAGWATLSAGLDWRSELRQADDAEASEDLRKRTHSGRPYGDGRFVSKLERKLGKSLAQNPVGRPRKEKREK